MTFKTKTDFDRMQQYCIYVVNRKTEHLMLHYNFGN